MVNQPTSFYMKNSCQNTAAGAHFMENSFPDNLLFSYFYVNTHTHTHTHTHTSPQSNPTHPHLDKSQKYNIFLTSASCPKHLHYTRADLFYGVGVRYSHEALFCGSVGVRCLHEALFCGSVGVRRHQSTRIFKPINK